MKEYGHEYRQSKIPKLPQPRRGSKKTAKRKLEDKTLKQLFDLLTSRYEDLVTDSERLKRTLESIKEFGANDESRYHNRYFGVWSLDSIEKTCNSMETIVELIDKKLP